MFSSIKAKFKAKFRKDRPLQKELSSNRLKGGPQSGIRGIPTWERARTHTRTQVGLGPTMGIK